MGKYTLSYGKCSINELLYKAFMPIRTLNLFLPYKTVDMSCWISTDDRARRRATLFIQHVTLCEGDSSLFRPPHRRTVSKATTGRLDGESGKVLACRC